MTPRIIRALVWKEALRYWHNRPSLVLAVLLVMVSLLVSVGKQSGLLGADDTQAICHVLYWNADDPFIAYLQAHLPAGRDVRIAPMSGYVNKDGIIAYPISDPRIATISIQIRPGDWVPGPEDDFDVASPPGESPAYKIVYWYPFGRAEALLPFRDWFNGCLRAYYGNAPAIVEASTTLRTPGGPVLPVNRVLISLTAIAVYLICFHLHILITGEERERRTLLAQMLTPMSVTDVLVAKVCFHVPAAMVLVSIILVSNAPIALSRPTFWVALASACIGYLSIGLIICSVTRSQSAAGLTALAYLMLVGITIYLGQTMVVFALLRAAMIDYHLMQLVNYSLGDKPPPWVPAQTAGLMVLAGGWALVAIKVFARQCRR